MKFVFIILCLSLSISSWAQPGRGAGTASPAGTVTPGASGTSEATAPGVIDLENISPEEMEENHSIESDAGLDKTPDTWRDKKEEGSTEIGLEKDEL